MTAIQERPVARVLLIDGSGRVLLFDTELSYTRVWMTPGGGLRPGESFEDAARRELWEEVGVAAVELSGCVWTVEFTFPRGSGAVRQAERYFIARVEAAQVVDENREEGESREIVRHRWWSVEEIATSADHFRPRDLAARLPAILGGDLPLEPPSAPVERCANVVEGD